MKIIQDPFVPFGCLVTAGVLTAALHSFYVGNKRRSNILLRARVAAQTVTIGFVAYGVWKAAAEGRSPFMDKDYQGNLSSAPFVESTPTAALPKKE